MPRVILVVEDMSPETTNTVQDVAALFATDGWIASKTDGGSLRVTAASGVNPPPTSANGAPILDFYKGLFATLKTDAVVYRIRAPNYPLHPGLAREIEEQFPLDRFSYVLSLADECGLEGYTVERLSAAAVDALSKMATPLLPQNYFNGMTLNTAGRHWFSLELRRFYLEECFELLFDSPRSVSINSVGSCNYSCAKCQFHSPSSKSGREFNQVMPLEKFERFLDRVADYARLRVIYPCVTGEPLTHPDIVTIVRRIKDNGYMCGFTTNAFALTPDMTDHLLDAGLDQLAISIDSIDPDKYQRLQEGGDLRTVEKNILNYRNKYFKKYGRFSATINCVVDEDNVDEQDAFRTRWLAEGFSVSFSTKYDFLNQNAPYFVNDGWGPVDRQPCWALWNSMYLTHDGRVVSCGSMAKTLGLKDNIFDTDPAALWRCENLTTLRQQQLTGVRPGYCKQFNCWTGMINTWTADEDGVKMRNLASVHYLSKHADGNWKRGVGDRLVSALRPVAKLVGITE